MTASGASQIPFASYAGSSCTGGGSGCTNIDYNSVNIRFTIPDKSSYKWQLHHALRTGTAYLWLSDLRAGERVGLTSSEFSVDPYPVGMPFLARLCRLVESRELPLRRSLPSFLPPNAHTPEPADLLPHHRTGLNGIRLILRPSIAYSITSKLISASSLMAIPRPGMSSCKSM